MSIESTSASASDVAASAVHVVGMNPHLNRSSRFAVEPALASASASGGVAAVEQTLTRMLTEPSLSGGQTSLSQPLAVPVSGFAVDYCEFAGSSRGASGEETALPSEGQVSVLVRVTDARYPGKSRLSEVSDQFFGKIRLTQIHGTSITCGASFLEERSLSSLDRATQAWHAASARGHVARSLADVRLCMAAALATSPVAVWRVLPALLQGLPVVGGNPTAREAARTLRRAIRRPPMHDRGSAVDHSAYVLISESSQSPLGPLVTSLLD